VPSGFASRHVDLSDRPDGPLRALRDALRDLMAWFDAEGIAGVLIGGVAAGLLGRPRITDDIDAVVLVDLAEAPSLLASAERNGFDARMDDALAFAARSRVLLLIHRSSGIEVDISFGILPFETRMVARARVDEVAGIKLRYPIPEDAIISKALPRRAKDIADIEHILEANPDVDFDEIRAAVREFAEVLEMPEILTDLDEILRRHRR